jgi:hypothetical protein
MPKNKKNGKAPADPEQKWAADESNLNLFIERLGAKGEKIIAETKAIQEGLHNINPLMIGHRLLNVRELMGVKVGDKKSHAAMAWKRYMMIRVYKLGFKKATCYRYMDAWTEATKTYPEPFVTEMASRLYGEKVSAEKPFGKYTEFVARTTKKTTTKEDIKTAAKSKQVVDAIMTVFKPSTKAPEKRDYLLTAYNSVMENILRYLKKQLGADALIDPMAAKDVFVHNLAPYLLAGFGCAKDYTETVEVKALPQDYEPFAAEEHRDRAAAAPMSVSTGEYIVGAKGDHHGVYRRADVPKGQQPDPSKAVFEGTQQQCFDKAVALNKPSVSKPPAHTERKKEDMAVAAG